MNIHNTKRLAVFSVAGMVVLLSACSSEPSPWTKKQSPWDQRRESMEAPAAETYKQDLGAEPQMSEVELSYQAEQVESSYVAPEPAAEAEVEPVEPADTGAAAGDDIMNQPAGYYTIQVIASVDVDRVYKFAEQNQLPIRYVVPTQREGVTWHVLLLDVYPDYPSARAALQEVAATLPTKPWIRKVGSVQKLMR